LDALRNGLSLSDELRGVKLRNDGFENFVADGGENTLIIVGAKVL
jgi:hypothetical protein